MAELKLQALDADDLKVLSAHCQDAIVRVAEMAFAAHERRFALLCNRFDWSDAQSRGWFSWRPFARRQAGLRFEGVRSIKVLGFDPAADANRPESTLTLLAITFTPDAEASPSGQVTLTFGGGAALRLDVDCVEAELRDLGAVWSTENKPDHSQAPPPDAPTAGPTKS